MKDYLLIFLASLSFIVISSCSTEESKQPASKSKLEKKTINQPKKPATNTQIKQDASFPKPKIGKVKEFFERYGKKHKETKVRLKTRLGNIDIQLYEHTPIHRANFIYNIKQELYYSTIFYRVVPDFMIQGGNSDHDRTLEKREEAGSYYIPNECKPELIHKRGAVAMAMMYDDNPDLKSSQFSYYIVIGTRFTDIGLNAVEEEYGISIPVDAREVYKTVGGTPHLDSKHTVFGEVISGMDVVEKIANEKRDSGDWPINDVVIEYEILD